MEVADEGAEDSFSAFEALEVHQALDRISVVHREVLTLRFLEDFSLKEIAEVTGAPEGTVKSRLFHAKRALRSVLDEEGGRGR